MIIFDITTLQFFQKQRFKKPDGGQTLQQMD